MLPTTVSNVHVRSSRVLLDGEARPALLRLAESGSDIHFVEVLAEGSVPAEEVIELADALIAPAPLDMHFHGAGGHVVPPVGDVGAIDEALREVSSTADWSHPSFVPEYGWMATLPVPLQGPADPVEHLLAAAHAVAARVDTSCVGLRIEGLFLNPSRAGVWPVATLRDPDIGLVHELHTAARDAGTPLRIIDIAPELDGAIELIEAARSLGIVVALAHSDATWEQAVRAIDAGATIATHTWNAMRPVNHREPGIVAACIVDPRVTCELICDGVHLHPGTVALTTAASGPGGWMAISDASPFAACPPGEYDWAGGTVTHDGRSLRDSAGRLAGSASLLTVAPATLAAAGLSEVDIVLALGAVPRRVLEPARPLGLVAGDPVWIAQLPSCASASR